MNSPVTPKIGQINKRKLSEKEPSKVKLDKFFSFVKKEANGSSCVSSSQTMLESIPIDLQEKTAFDSYFKPFCLKPNAVLAPIYRRRRRRKIVNTETVIYLNTKLDDQENRDFNLLEMQAKGNTEKYSWSSTDRNISRSSCISWKDNCKNQQEKFIRHLALLQQTEQDQSILLVPFKILKFHDTIRPAYFGTWSKVSERIRPRHPFGRDEQQLDYTYNSDDDWEDEDLEGSDVEDLDSENDEEEDEEEDDDPEDDGWVVPHGYLSEGEGVEEDDLLSEDDNTNADDLDDPFEKIQLKRNIKEASSKKVIQNNTTKTTLLPKIIGPLFIHNESVDRSFCQYSVFDVDKLKHYPLRLLDSLQEALLLNYANSINNPHSENTISENEPSQSISHQVALIASLYGNLSRNVDTMDSQTAISPHSNMPEGSFDPFLHVFSLPDPKEAILEGPLATDVPILSTLKQTVPKEELRLLKEKEKLDRKEIKEKEKEERKRLRDLERETERKRRLEEKEAEKRRKLEAKKEELDTKKEEQQKELESLTKLVHSVPIITHGEPITQFTPALTLMLIKIVHGSSLSQSKLYEEFRRRVGSISRKLFEDKLIECTIKERRPSVNPKKFLWFIKEEILRDSDISQIDLDRIIKVNSSAVLLPAVDTFETGSGSIVQSVVIEPLNGLGHSQKYMEKDENWMETDTIKELIGRESVSFYNPFVSLSDLHMRAPLLDYCRNSTSIIEHTIHKANLLSINSNTHDNNNAIENTQDLENNKNLCNTLNAQDTCNKRNETACSILKPRRIVPIQCIPPSL